MSKHDKKGKASGKKTGYPKPNRSYGKDQAPAQPKKTNPSRSASDGIRLNKYIANSGICSRREADLYIQTGQVTVDGKVVNEMGFRVKPNQDVRFDGRRISPEPASFVLLNKPKGVATTSSESKGLTVMDIIANATSAQVKPFGRLGRNATGLLLFTNDDSFRQKFSKKGIDRLFHVELDKNLKPDDLQRIKEGIKIEGKEVKVEEISYVKNSPKKEVGLRIKHTGNSVIRNIFENLNYNVVKVDCVTLGPLTKKDLPRGRYRHLTTQELELFNML